MVSPQVLSVCICVTLSNATALVGGLRGLSRRLCNDFIIGVPPRPPLWPLTVAANSDNNDSYSDNLNSSYNNKKQQLQKRARTSS